MATETISQSGEPDFRLGDWWVRPQRNLLERGDQQERVEARSMAVLVCLAKRATRVVSKDRLLSEVWSDAPHVGEEVLSHAIWDLRRALADSAKEPRYFETIPRKGYRLVVEVSREFVVPVKATESAFEHYALGEEIGRGAMAVVHRATDRRLGRQVAIKFLAPELVRDLDALKRFEREARLAASIDHPNLATVLEIGVTAEGARRYLVAPFYAGGSLKELIARGPLTVGESLRLTRQLLAGLGAAHQHAIVHRDIKPANLMLDEFGTLKIADFGIAKLIGSTDLSRTMAALGTPAYKSPEQSRGENVDHRSDLWSAGIVLAELLTGERPFQGEFEGALSHAIQSQEPNLAKNARSRELPAALLEVMEKAIAKDPANRFQNAADFEVALARLSSVPKAVEKRPWRLLATTGAAVFVAALLVASGWKLSRQAHRLGGVDPIARATLQQGQALWLRGNDLNGLVEVHDYLKLAASKAPRWGEAQALLAVFHAEREAVLDNAGIRDVSHRNLQILKTMIGYAGKTDPDTSLIDLAQARLFLLESNYVEAVRAARHALEQEPTCASPRPCDLAYVWLSEALWKLERESEAEIVLQDCLSVDAGGGWIRCTLKLAELHEWFGETDRAVREYEALLVISPHQTTALKALGDLHVDLGQFEKAEKHYRRLVEETHSPLAQQDLGVALYGQEKWIESLGAFQEAERLFLGLDLKIPVTAELLGDVHLELGRPVEARPWFEKALKRYDDLVTTPGPPRPLRSAKRAVCLAKLGQFKQARDAILKLDDYLIEIPEIAFHRARIAALEQDRERLFISARYSVSYGMPHHRFLGDAAFISFRKDPKFLEFLANPFPERPTALQTRGPIPPPLDPSAPAAPPIGPKGEARTDGSGKTLSPFR